MTDRSTEDSLHPFTEAWYDRFLVELSEHFRFEFFETAEVEPHLLMRHDVDFSVQRAVAMARIEAGRQVRATYFLRLRSELYNLLETPCRRGVETIVGLGHAIGLHYDYTEPLSGALLDERVSFDAEILRREFGAPVEVVAFHDPVTAGTLGNYDTRVGGLFSAYSSAVRNRYRYFSDSFGHWNPSTPDPARSAPRASLRCSCRFTRNGGCQATSPGPSWTASHEHCAVVTTPTGTGTPLTSVPAARRSGSTAHTAPSMTTMASQGTHGVSHVGMRPASEGPGGRFRCGARRRYPP